MPVGSIILTIVAVAAFFGLLHRVLDRMGLTDWVAVLWIAAIVAGSYFNFSVGRYPQLSVNAGGAIIPLVFCVYLINRADTSTESLRAVFALIITGVFIFGLGKILPADPHEMVIDPLWAFGVAGGIVAYLLGRSRRSAFVAGTMGILVADLIHFGELVMRDIPGRVWLGGGGAFDAVVIAGVVAVFLAEIVGEVRERFAREAGVRDGAL